METTVKKILLIVEDESSARKAMFEKFTREGFEVVVAFNGEDGLEQAKKTHPDLILLDIIMPKMDGITMLEKLREDSEWGKQVPVIIVTNNTIEGDEKIKRINELGTDCYHIKADWKNSDVVEKGKTTLRMT